MAAPTAAPAVVGHERQAWLRHVRANDAGPDVEAYLPTGSTDSSEPAPVRTDRENGAMARRDGGHARGPVAPEAVLDHVGEGPDLIVPLANGEPVAVLDALEAHSERLSGVRVHQMDALHERPYPSGAFDDRLRHVSAVNEHMPRTFGLKRIHVSQVAADREPHRRARPRRGHDPGGHRWRPERPDGGLTEHEDLRGHTELVSDGIMDLVECGAVTGTRKQERPNKVVGTFALGTQRLYEWLHDNRAVEMLPVDFVNDPRVIARERDFISINATTEVDLMGQCASETIGGRYWSSSGGQADFARGAMYSGGGQGFIVLRSTTSSGRSPIRARLTERSAVTTLENTVDYVVTEWRVAKLRGRSIADRDRALIAIADPGERKDLEREATDLGLLPRRTVRAAQPVERRVRSSAPSG